MATRRGRVPVVVGLAIDVVTAAAEFTAAAVTGSSSVLAEAIHSTVEIIEGVLLWTGLRRSVRPPDDAHPFGHGMELHFWTMMMAMVVFAFGGGMSVLEGIWRALHPEPPRHAVWSYAVLGASALATGASWLVALRDFRGERHGRGIWETYEETKNPLAFVVLFEDSAAFVGTLAALAGVFLSSVTGSGYFDAAGSCVVGLLLMSVAFLLARETRGLQIGEAAKRKTVEEIRAVVEKDPAVSRVGRVLTVHFGPDTIVLNLELQFRRDLTASAIGDAVARLEDALRKDHRKLKYIYIEGRNICEKGPERLRRPGPRADGGEPASPP